MGRSRWVRSVLLSVWLLGISDCRLGRSEEAIGQVKTVLGTVTLRRANHHHPAQPGLILLEGDTLTTDRVDSRVSVVMIDSTRFVLGPHSQLLLHRYRYNPTTQTGDMAARLQHGTLAVHSGRLGGAEDARLTVMTRQSTVTVRHAQTAIAVKE